MASHPRSFEPADDAWEVLDQMVDEVDRLARSAPPPAVFWPELLRRVVTGLAAEGGIVWPCDDAGTPRAEGRYTFGRCESADGHGSPDAARLAGAMAAAQDRRARDIGPATKTRNGTRVRLVDEQEPLNPTEELRLIAPAVVDDRATVVIDVGFRRDLEPDTRRAALRLMEGIAEASGDYCRERQRQTLVDEAETLRQVDEFALRLHSADDGAAVAYVLVAEAARLIPCERAALVTLDGGSRAVAVSGADLVDRRAPQVRGLEQLAAAVAASGDSLRIGVGDRRVPPTAAAALDAYLATSSIRAIAIEPIAVRSAALSRTGAAPSGDLPDAMLVVENFNDAATGRPWNDERLAMLARHGGLALARARELDAVPSAFRRRGKPGTAGIRRGGLLVGLAVVLLVGPFLIPAEFKLESRGVLQPTNRRDVFAPADGIVQEILVSDGQTVKADDVLVRLRRPELDVELARVLGEIETARSRLKSIGALRSSPASDAAAERRGQELAAEAEQLTKTLAGRDSELKLLRKQQEALEIRAPSAGRVIAWDLEQTLAGRPVARGARLFEVADVNGAWIVDLRIAERDAGDLAAARGNPGEPLDVEFIAAVAPERRFAGRLMRVAPAAEIDPEHGVVVPAVVETDGDAAIATGRRPGAVVTAKIHCGRQSLGYVWWHDAWRGLQSLWF